MDGIYRAVPTLSLTTVSSLSRPADANTTGATGTRTPVKTQARWLGAKRGASSPSLISRVTAKRLNAVAGRNNRSLFEKPFDGVSMSPSAAKSINGKEDPERNGVTRGQEPRE